MISKYGKHPSLVVEKKGISDEVDKLANDVIEQIWNDSLSKQRMFSPRTKLYYVDGSFKLDGFDGELSVNYVLYFFDTIESYNSNIDLMHDSSSFDDETKTMRVSTGLIDGELTYAIYEEVYHELLHYFEYSKGMTKNVDLYNKVSDFITKSVKPENDILLNVAKLVYYSFPHEQDAFAHQFYGFLKKMRPTDEFQVLLYNASMFRALDYSYMVFKHGLADNRKNIITLLLHFGMNLESFKKRIHFGRKRLEKKLKQVYNRYKEEAKERTLPESLHKQYSLFNFDSGIKMKEEILSPW